MAKKIIIAGGGTGGHIFPAIAIANALKKLEPAVNIFFVGARGRMEMEKIPQAGFQIEGLDIAGYNRSSLIKNLALPFKLVKSFLQVRKIFQREKPDAVVGVGGYSSFPVLRYAQAKGIPSFIHESNSFAGKSNQMLGRKATRVFVASEGMEKFFPKEKISISGNPVRPAIANMNTISKADALKFFGLSEAKKTLLVVGGSLGARSINEAMAEGMNDLVKENLQLIWQTGKPNAADWKIKGEKPGVWVNDFINQMEMAYAAADMVISRAGAMAIAELCVVKKPVIFVPFPFAAEDHQTVNAMNLVEKNAAIMIRDSEVKQKLIPAVIELSRNEQKQEALKTNISRFGIVDADVKVAKEILEIINN